VGLERGPLSLVSTTEELLGRKSSGSGLETGDYGRKDHLSANVGTIFSDKRQSHGRHSSFADSGHRDCLCCVSDGRFGVQFLAGPTLSASVDNTALSVGVKQPRREADCSPTIIIGAMPSLPQSSLWRA
jgi:hypothetical protein